MNRRVAAALAVAALLLAPRAALPAGRADDAVRLPSVTTEGTPRGLVTVVVPLPAELRDEADVEYEVRLSGDIEVLGRLRGIARRGGAAARPLLLTLRVPALADAGELNAAEVLFRGGSGREYVVPLILRVAVVRSIALLGEREMRNLRAGDRLHLAYRVVNGGNAVDSVRVLVRAPAGWAARLDRPALVVIGARSEVEFTVALGIPTAVNIGDHSLAVSVLGPSSGEAIATLFSTLGVTGRAGPTGGLVLRPTVATAVSTSGSATFTGLELTGPVSQGMRLRLALSPTPSRSGATSLGLSSVGAHAVPFAASLSGDDWALVAGNTSLQLSDLGGTNVVGRGITGQLAGERVEARGIVALPGSSGGAGGGHLVGAGYWRQTPYGRLGGAASLLAEGRTAMGRELTAIAADYRSPTLGTMAFGATVGYRTGGGDHGVGVGASVSHARPGDRFTVRASHAPGGSAAFARAVDEWQAEGSRMITSRWIVDGSAQQSWDRSPQGTSMAVSSWSASQRVIMTNELSVTMRTQGSAFTAGAQGGVGAFGAEDRDLGAGLEWRRALVALSGEVSQGYVQRATELLSGERDVSSAAQRRIRLNATRGWERWGVLDAGVSLDQTASGVGIPREVWMSRLRWSEVPLRVGTRVFRAGSEVMLQRLGDLRSAVTWRSDVQAALPGGFDLEVSAERNPYLRDRTGRATWIGALRLSASTRVFTPRPLGPEGIVWEDRDLDGKRDALEPGVAGVVVRRGDAKAVTDRAGRYRLPVDARGRTTLEQSSLPVGLLAHPTLASDHSERLDLPVLPTGSVVVDFTPVPDEDGRLPSVDLEPVVVLLRDASGFEWVGRRGPGNTARFEGIPIGTYTLSFDLSRLREPLRHEEGLSVRVEPRVSGTLRAPLRQRAVRVFTPPRSAGGKGP